MDFIDLQLLTSFGMRAPSYFVQMEFAHHLVKLECWASPESVYQAGLVCWVSLPKRVKELYAKHESSCGQISVMWPVTNVEIFQISLMALFLRQLHLLVFLLLSFL
jgi:hypothetical protein